MILLINAYHSAIKLKPVDILILINKNNNQDPEFKIWYHVTISKYKKIFAESCVSNWSEELFVIIKTKNAVPYVISHLKGK